MKRRAFITLLGGAAVWPLTARAQQAERVRRVGVLMNLAADDAEGKARLTAFAQGLQELGWVTTCELTIGGAEGVPTVFVHTERNWSRPDPT